MDNISSGNLNTKESKLNKGWFIGHFIENNEFFKTQDFEVAWKVHKKGDKNESIAKNKIAKTLSVLIKGKCLWTFPEKNNQIILENEGDYIFWDSGIAHSWEILEDSTILTIRWPSINGDQSGL